MSFPCPRCGYLGNALNSGGICNRCTNLDKEYKKIMFIDESVKCNWCKGIGKIGLMRCIECDGSGRK